VADPAHFHRTGTVRTDTVRTASVPTNPVGRGSIAALAAWILLLAALAPPQAAAQAAPLQIPLECRLGDGPWQACRMEVEQVGAHWFLLIGERRIEFRHDGRGAVTMQEQGHSRAVNSRWLEDRSLCWDGTCARGDIPLD
jgi:hypothetical protein